MIARNDETPGRPRQVQGRAGPISLPIAASTRLRRDQPQGLRGPTSRRPVPLLVRRSRFPAISARSFNRYTWPDPLGQLAEDDCISELFPFASSPAAIVTKSAPRRPELDSGNAADLEERLHIVASRLASVGAALRCCPETFRTAAGPDFVPGRAEFSPALSGIPCETKFLRLAGAALR